MPDNWIGRILMSDEEYIYDNDGNLLHNLLPCNLGEGRAIHPGAFPLLSNKMTTMPNISPLVATPVMVKVSETQIIESESSSTIQYFGDTIAVSADGQHLVIGAYYDGSSPLYTGTIYLKDRVDSGTFTSGGGHTYQQATGNIPTAAHRFGEAVAISDDGATVAVSAYHSAGYDGVVYILNATGSRVQTIENPLARDDRFGFNLTLSGDGQYLIVSTSHFQTPVEGQEHSHHVYKHNGTEFALIQTISNPTRVDLGLRGVEIASNGSRLVVADEPTIYVYKLDNGQYVEEIALSEPLESGESNHAYKPRITSGGTTVIASSDKYVYTWDLVEGIWSLDNKFVRTTGYTLVSVSPNGKFLAVGAIEELAFYHRDDRTSDWVFDQLLESGDDGNSWGYPVMMNDGSVLVPESRYETGKGRVHFYAGAPNIVGHYKVISDPRLPVAEGNYLGSATISVVPRVQTISLDIVTFAKLDVATQYLGSASISVTPRAQTINLGITTYTQLDLDTQYLGSATISVVPRVQTILLTTGTQDA